MESCHNTYANIMLTLPQQHYCENVTVGEYFPEEPKKITQTQLSAKLKAVQNKLGIIFTHHQPTHTHHRS